MILLDSFGVFKGLLIDSILNVLEELVVVIRERLQEAEEWSEALFIKDIDSFFKRRIVLNQVLKDLLVFNIENFILKGKQNIRFFVDRHLIFKELKETGVVLIKADRERCAFLVILYGKVSSEPDKNLGYSLLNIYEFQVISFIFTILIAII